MSLKREDVLHIARLARIALTEEEIEKFQKQLSSIVDFISLLKEVDVEGIAETAQVTGLKDVYRPDVAQQKDKSITQGLVKAFPVSATLPGQFPLPKASGALLKVPPIFE